MTQSMPALRAAPRSRTGLWPRGRVRHLSLFAQFGDCLASLAFGFLAGSTALVAAFSVPALLSGMDDSGMIAIAMLLMLVLSAAMTILLLVPLFLVILFEKRLGADAGTIVWATAIGIATGLTGSWMSADAGPLIGLVCLPIGFLAGALAHRRRLEHIDFQDD